MFTKQSTQYSSVATFYLFSYFLQTFPDTYFCLNFSGESREIKLQSLAESHSHDFFQPLLRLPFVATGIRASSNRINVEDKNTITDPNIAK